MNCQMVEIIELLNKMIIGNIILYKKTGSVFSNIFDFGSFIGFL